MVLILFEPLTIQVLHELNVPGSLCWYEHCAL